MTAVIGASRRACILCVMDHFDAAVTALRKGGVIAYPTEGVWGLGCDPRDEAAVLRLLALKQRAVDKGLILIASDEAQLADFVDMSPLDAATREVVRASWPGPNTWIVPASSTAPIVRPPPRRSASPTATRWTPPSSSTPRR